MLKKTFIILLVLTGTILLQTKTFKINEKENQSFEKTVNTLNEEQGKVSNTLLDVPLENQFAGDVPLENGCEITALSMLLQFYGYKTNKNELAEKLAYVPVYEDEENDIHGDPRSGFVGNIYEGYLAMGAFVEPIAKVAKSVVQSDYRVVSSSNTDFYSLLQQVMNGVPVWIVTTVDFVIPTESDFMLWQTNNGSVSVTALCHAVVITGVKDSDIYVNDPYGQKEVVNLDVLKSIYEKMGSQSLYLAKKG